MILVSTMVDNNSFTRWLFKSKINNNNNNILIRIQKLNNFIFDKIISFSISHYYNVVKILLFKFKLNFDNNKYFKISLNFKNLTVEFNKKTLFDIM